MKKLLFLILLYGCSNKNEVIEYWPDGTLKLTGTEIEGVKEGYWVHFQNYNQDTIKIEYFKLGMVFQIDHYAYMAINDSTSTPNTKLVDRTEYSDTLKHGTQITFYQSGKIQSKARFVKDIAVGEYSRYFENGKIEVKSEYSSDTLISFAQFHPNGNIAIKAKKPKNGINSFYDSLGILTFKVLYKNWQPIDTLSL